MISKIAVITFFASSFALAQGYELTRSLDCNWVDPIQTGFLQNHLTIKQKDVTLQERVTTQYVKNLDASKIYLLEADVATIKTNLKNLFQNIEKNDCKFLGENQALVVKRYEERLAQVKEILGKNFKFNKETVFTYDPEHKTFPKNTEEASEFLKKYTQLQIANYLATDIKLPEAKERVIKNYERAFKRIKETKPEALVSNYLNSFALALDPHSTFFSKDYYDDFNIDMSLSLEGIGATLSQEDGFTKVENLVSGGAAAKSGLVEPMDKIIAVSKKNGKMENVVDMELKDVVKLIRGPKGTKVKLTVLRKVEGANKKIDIELVREKISLDDSAVSIQYIDKEVNGLKKKIGIINFPSFYSDSKRGGRSSAADMKKIIADAKAKKADGLVLDLANNGGGSLEDAVKIGGLFIQKGNIVKQSSRREGNESALADSDSMVDWSGPLVVLTSRLSASASEIVSGAMKDYGRAVVVGNDHTYGKGSIQTVLPVPGDLGALKVTIGMFFTPGGYSTQNRGVESDVVIPGAFTLDDIGEKGMDYALPSKKIDSFISKEAFVEKGDGAWAPIKSEWVTKLKFKSSQRVAKSEDFKKVSDELEKTKKNGKTIKVADVVKEKSEKEKKDKTKKTGKYASKEEKDKEYLKRADVQEAGEVLLDLIQLQAGNDITLTKTK